MEFKTSSGVNHTAERDRRILERNPTEDEVAERLQITVAELRELKFDAQCRTHVSTRYVSPIDDTMVEQEFPSRRETQPDNSFR